MKNFINDKDINFWRKVLNCKNCDGAFKCYRYGSYGQVCSKYTDDFKDSYYTAIINSHLDSQIENLIANINPLRDSRMRIEVFDENNRITKSAQDSLYGYHIRYINDILKQIRSGKMEFVYDIEKLKIIKAYEPNMKVISCVDGCFYIKKED